MGNCQAAEEATVLVQHPTGRLERFYWSLTASQVMESNPGHYVAVLVNAAPRGGGGGAAPVKHLKLLRPDDTLHIGHVYRLVSFEEVLRVFASKKHVKLSKLLTAQKEINGASRRAAGGQSSSVEERPVEAEAEAENCSRRTTSSSQWRPALQSIAEIGG